MNNYELTTDYFSFNYIRYPKRFSWKAFKKFGYVKGQVLSEKYDIILTDYRTRNEKIKDILAKFNQKNFDKGMKKFNKVVKKI